MVKVIHTRFKRMDTLKKTLLKSSTDAHDLTRRLHLRAKGVGCRSKLIEGESRKL